MILILTSHDSCSGKAKPSKKASLTKPADDINLSEPEKQPESPHPQQTAEATIDNSPPEDREASMDHVDVEPTTSKPPSPIKPAEEKTNDVVVTGFGFTAPGQPTALSKHNTKEEISADDKGKWKVDLESYAQFSTQDIHSGYLNHLYTSRDFEAGLVNLMKERYEVIQSPFSFIITCPSASKSIGYDRILNML